jgi:transposase
MCVKIYKQVLANYRTTKSNKHKIEKPLNMKNPVIQLDKRLYSCMTRTSIKLANGNGARRSVVKFMTYPKFDEYADKYRMCDPLIKYEESTGEFYACIPFLTLSTTPYEDYVLGVDLGMKRIATLSDGTALRDKKYLANRRRIRHNKRVM